MCNFFPRGTNQICKARLFSNTPPVGHCLDKQVSSHHWLIKYYDVAQTAIPFGATNSTEITRHLKDFFFLFCVPLFNENVHMCTFLLQFSIACWKLDGKLYVMQMTKFQT